MESLTKLTITTLTNPRIHLYAIAPFFLFLTFLCLSPSFFFTATNNDSGAAASVSFASRPFSLSSFSPVDSSNTCPVVSECTTLSSVAAATETPRWKSRIEDDGFLTQPPTAEATSSCNIFDGNWVPDDSDPVYPPGSCPFLDDSFNCFKNGRADLGYLRFRWKPYECDIPRFNGRKMLEILRGKRVVFVGDSLNRNMWQALVCSLRESVKNKSGIFEEFGRREFRTQGFYSVKFTEFNSSLDFVKSPFLVQEWKDSNRTTTGNRKKRETLRLDMIQSSFSDYRNADIIVFNTGHWWTHKKTNRGKNYYQEGSHVYSKLKVTEAYKKALWTWAQWVDSNINGSNTRVFFRGYSASHFRGRRCSGGGMVNETSTREVGANPWMMKAVEAVMSEMKTPVYYLNITKMTSYRGDGHPAIYHDRRAGGGGMFEDCSHWCLPGVPDSWNQLLFAALLPS
ncbi:Protein trichome birefringence-like 4 [Linum grandiflorum]